MTREEKIAQKIKEANIKCIHNIVDGCGNYCPFFQVPLDYPHKFYRTDCYGRLYLCRCKQFYKV